MAHKDHSEKMYLQEAQPKHLCHTEEALRKHNCAMS